MNLPFTTTEFLNIFIKYNTAVWPAQIILYLSGILIVFLCFFKLKHSDFWIPFILAIFWLWMGIVYHIIFFSAINKAAVIFGAFFIIQGLLFLREAIFQKSLSFRFRLNVIHLLGLLYILYAIIIYPWWTYYLGHTYPETPLLGVPCPTTIFTFGILLWAYKKVPQILLVIPLLWSIIGFTAAFKLSMKPDLVLFPAGLLSVILIIVRNRSLKNSSQ